MTDLIQGVIGSGFPVAEVPVQGGWLEVDSREDLAIAEGRMSTENGALRIAS